MPIKAGCDTIQMQKYLSSALFDDIESKIRGNVDAHTPSHTSHTHTHTHTAAKETDVIDVTGDDVRRLGRNNAIYMPLNAQRKVTNVTLSGFPV